MKTNISIELTDEQRLNLAQKYNNTTNKKLLTRIELKDIVLESDLLPPQTVGASRNAGFSTVAG